MILAKRKCMNIAFTYAPEITDDGGPKKCKLIYDCALTMGTLSVRT